MWNGSPDACPALVKTWQLVAREEEDCSSSLPPRLTSPTATREEQGERPLNGTMCPSEMYPPGPMKPPPRVSVTHFFVTWVVGPSPEFYSPPTTVADTPSENKQM